MLFIHIPTENTHIYIYILDMHILWWKDDNMQTLIQNQQPKISKKKKGEKTAES